MKKILFATVLMAITAGAYAASFSDLQVLTTSDIKAGVATAPWAPPYNATGAAPDFEKQYRDGLRQVSRIVAEGNAVQRKKALKTLDDLTAMMLTHTLGISASKIQDLYNEGLQEVNLVISYGNAEQREEALKTLDSLTAMMLRAQK